MRTPHTRGWVRMATGIIETALPEDRHKTTRMLMRPGAIIDGQEPSIDLTRQTISFLGHTTAWDADDPTESFLDLCRKITND